MTSYQRKMRTSCGRLRCPAQSASSPEQRESFLDLANKWRVLANSQKLIEVPPRALASAGGTTDVR